MQPATQTVYNGANVPTVKETTDIIKALRYRAKKDKVFDNVAHVFALRERARQQVTIPALRLRMGENGFNHKDEEYAEVIKFLASLGFGTIEKDKYGSVHALKNIRITLQSIGQAAVGNVDKLTSFNRQFDFDKLPADEGVKHMMPQEIVQSSAYSRPLPIVSPEIAAVKSQTVVPKIKPIEGIKVTITAYIDGSPVTFPLPKNLTTHELGDMLATVYSKRNA